ncbi:MAG: CHRD domain-containing protein [Sulfuricaulis sp.]
MNVILQKSRFTLAVVTVIAVLLAGGTGMAMAAKVKVTLSGDQEVPPVSTSAKGSGTIIVGANKSVKGSVKTSGVDGKAAHIHEGAPGENGPVIIPLKKKSAKVWSVPAGAKLTDEQYKSYKAGNLYINVHSAANKGGEIRGQIKP